MQFLMYSTDQDPQAAPPSPEVMAEVDQLTEDSKKSGVLIATGGLHPTGTRVRLAGGKVTVTDGPYIEAKELMGGFALLRVQSLQEAIEWATRFRTIIGDGTTEIVQVFGPEA